MAEPSTRPPRAEEREEDVRATCKILETVAAGFAPDGPEQEAIRRAAQAFLFLQQHEGLKQAYDEFRRASGQPLTASQKETLVSMGIAVDD